MIYATHNSGIIPQVTLDQSKPLTYEMAVKPEKIGIHKSFNSFNTGTVLYYLIMLFFLVSGTSGSWRSEKKS